MEGEDMNLEALSRSSRACTDFIKELVLQNERYGFPCAACMLGTLMFSGVIVFEECGRAVLLDMLIKALKSVGGLRMEEGKEEEFFDKFKERFHGKDSD